MDILSCGIFTVLQKYRLGKISGKDMGEGPKDGRFFSNSFPFLVYNLKCICATINEFG